MIGNANAGWCKFKLDSFTGNPSYLTDVPMDLLDAFLAFYTNGTPSCAFFDEEGSWFTLVLSRYNIYIIHETDEQKLFEINKDVDDIAKELISDIKSDINAWNEEFCLEDDETGIEEHKRLLIEKANKLEYLLSKF